MHRLILFGIGLLFLAMSCQHPRSASPDAPAGIEKMDAVLRAALAQASPDSTLRFTLRVRTPLSEAVRADLEAAGLTLGTVVGNLITASGPPEAIRAVAAFPAVLRLEGARRVRPN